MLPMGTIMAANMLLGVIFALAISKMNLAQKLTLVITRIVAVSVMISGLWNVFWYAAQNIQHFWGQAAFVSGVLMILTALYIFIPQKISGVLKAIKPGVLLLLSASCVLYSYTIYNL